VIVWFCLFLYLVHFCFRERSEKTDGGFRTERSEGGGFAQREGGPRGEGGFGRGRGRGRGARGRGGRGTGGGFPTGKREFERHSGSDRT